MKAEFTDEQYNQLTQLISLCTDADIFVYDGMLVRGNKVTVTKEYVKLNPSKKFRIWLIDKGYVIRN